MILISHRGNTRGPNPTEENKTRYLDLALSEGFEVELDIRVLDGRIFLGHDDPTQEIGIEWILERKDRLWVHCKNLEALTFFSSITNCFWHQQDDYTLTSKGFVWAYPGKRLSVGSIAVLPELWTEKIDLDCRGVCSDFIERWVR